MKIPEDIGRGMLAGVFSAAALAVAADSLAQFGGGLPGSGGFPGGGGMRGSRGGDRNASREQQRPAAAEPRVNSLEQTIEELRVDLKLLPAQMPAWDAYTGKLRALAGDIARSCDRMPAGPESDVLQRLDRSVDAARNRLAAVEEVSDAARALFALLAPEQRAAANPRLATIVNMQVESSRMTGAK
jgi:hypothetical protein